MSAQFGIMKSLNNQPTTVLSTIAMNKHMSVGKVKARNSPDRLFHILPTDIGYLFIQREMKILYPFLFDYFNYFRFIFLRYIYHHLDFGREYPFIVQEKDCVLQGYIDYLSVGDKIVLIDFKSDYVDSDDILIRRYHSQIEAYKKALTILYPNQAIQTYIYPFRLSKMIEL